MSTRSFENTCYHEAGHAIVAQLLGVNVVNLKLRERMLKGQASSWSGSVETAPTNLQNRVQIAMAGPVAESIYATWKYQSLEAAFETVQGDVVFGGFTNIPAYRTNGIKVPFHSNAQKRKWLAGSREYYESETQIFVTGWLDDWEVVKDANVTRAEFDFVLQLVQANWDAVSRASAQLHSRSTTAMGLTASFPVFYEVIE